MADVPWETDESRNFICIQTIVTDIISGELRKIFIQEWNTRYQTSFGAWDDTSVSGQQLFHFEKLRARPNKNMLQSKFKHGDTNQWDCSVFFDAILFSKSIGSSLNATIKNEVNILRKVRNQVAHSSETKISDVLFQTMISDIENAFKVLGIPLHHVTRIKKKRNLYKSFQVLSPKPTHEVVYRTEILNKIKQRLQNMRTDSGGELTYFYISGNPGSGKSQLARQLGEDLYKSTNWHAETTYVMTLNARDLDTLLHSYEEFGRHLNCWEDVLVNIMNSSKPKADKIKNLRSQIATRIRNWTRWWIIIDNVEDIDIVSPLLPQMGDDLWNNGQIILTTQNTKSVPSESMLTKHISISDGMNNNECRQLLSVLSVTDLNDPILDEVAKQLDHQPLAMAAAAVYVKAVTKTSFSWHDFIDKLEKGKRRITEQQLLKISQIAYSSTMSASVLLAVEKSAEENFILDQTFDLFSLISFETLPLNIIVNYIQQLDESFEKEEIYLTIKHCSLFLVEESEDIDVRLHHVVHEAIKSFSDCKKTKLKEDYESENRGKVGSVGFLGRVQSLFKAKATKNMKIPLPFLNIIQRVVKSFRARDDKTKIVPHLKAFYENINHLLPESNPLYSLIAGIQKYEIMIIYKFFGRCLRDQCEFNLALQFQKVNLLLYQNCKNHPFLADIHVDLSSLYHDIGEFDKAKEHVQQSLQIRIKALGPTHVDVASSYNNLGLVYESKGQLEQAKDYHQRSLDILIKALGPMHNSVATSYNNLGSVYRAMGQLERAKDYHQRSLEIKIKALGPTHVDVARLYNNLGLVYESMGHLEQAKEYHQKSLDITIRALGPTHVEVAMSYNNLGLVYRKMGHLEQAKAYHQRSLDITIKVLGPTHVDVATSYNNLGSVYEGLGQLEQAKDYHQKSLAIRIKALGPTHVDVAMSYNNLGLVQKKLGLLVQANDYHQRSLDITMKALGQTHVDVATSYNNLGSVYEELGQLEQAKDYHQQSLEIRIKVLGPTHVDVAMSYNNLGLVYKKMGQLEQAKDYLQRSLDITIKALGQTHVDVATLYNNLGLVYETMGQLEQAKDYLRRSLDITIKALGSTHVSVATSYNNLGSVYIKMEQLEQAKNYLQRSLYITIKALGPMHIHVATSYNNLGLVYETMGQLEQAKDYLRRSLDITIKALSPTHVDVATSYNNLSLVYIKMGQLVQDKDYRQRSLDITTKALGPTHVDVATSYSNLGSVHEEMGQLEQAKDYHQRSLEIRIKALGPTHVDVATSYINLFLVYIKLGQLKQAKDCYKRSLDMMIKAYMVERMLMWLHRNNNPAEVCEMVEKFGQARDY